MIIEKTDKEIIIRLPNTMDTSFIEEIVDYIRFNEITSKSYATQKGVDSLVKEVKQGRWQKNKKRIFSQP